MTKIRKGAGISLKGCAHTYKMLSRGRHVLNKRIEKFESSGFKVFLIQLNHNYVLLKCFPPWFFKHKFFQ